ncbi:hypothetical protein [Filimonas effusa]|uniref:Uncharacterized protein n=1 Tax=Filimonas effusa TaxID=2508721 RepID=A0A4Q1D7Q3_9BACT|nr:hypothetical protein [Filimonas effusa]RXK83737.1 hypothetical protein ESB13_16810 [Filimonas effusa]
MSIEKERIKIDFTRSDLPASVKNFRPDIYQDENGFYCILGTDPAERIIGRGDTVEKALQEWDKNYVAQKGSGN